MRTTIIRLSLLAATFCTAAVAQTSAPATPRFDLHVVNGPAATLYLDGTRPIVKKSSKGLTSYAYKHGRPAIVMHPDGSYAELKYENGKLDRIEYSDGTVRRAGDKLAPSAGASIAARGGIAPMNYGSSWDDDWGTENYYFQYDGGGRSDGGWDGGGDFPRGEQPDNPWKRIKCLADAMVTLKVAFTEVCPMMRDQTVCIDQAMKLHDELINWCMGS
jgi:hypothetical protein